MYSITGSTAKLLGLHMAQSFVLTALLRVSLRLVWGNKVTYLHAVVTEEKARIGAHAHLEAGGAAPDGRLPDQQREGAALVAAVAGAEDV